MRALFKKITLYLLKNVQIEQTQARRYSTVILIITITTDQVPEVEKAIALDGYQYDAFGQRIAGGLAGSADWGYNGKHRDAVTGWYNYGYRDYSHGMMRLTIEDPINRIDPRRLENIVIFSAIGR